MESPSFLKESCLGKSFSAGRGERLCRFSPVQDIFHNYKEELSHNSSTQLQLIPCLLLALQPVPAPPSLRDGWRRGHLPTQCFPPWHCQLRAKSLGRGWCQPLQWVPHRAPQGWQEGTQPARGDRKEMHTASQAIATGAAPPATTPSFLLRASSLLLPSIRVRCLGFPAGSTPGCFSSLALVPAAPRHGVFAAQEEAVQQNKAPKVEPGHFCHLWW